jgi:hypothetical protein
MHPKNGEITMIYSQTGKNNAPFDSLIFTGLPSIGMFNGLVKTTINGTRINYKPFAILDSIKIGEPQKMVGLPDGSIAMWAKVIKESNVFIKGQSITLNKNKDQDLFIETSPNLMAKYLIALEKGSNSTSVNLASYQNKVAVAGNMFLPNDTLLTINKTTLAAGSNDPTFATDFPLFATTRADVYITQWDRSLEANSTNGLNQNKIETNTSVFPNPFTHNLTIQSFDNIQEITITNLSGQLVKHIPLNSNQATINLECLSPGLYFITYKNEIGSATKRIVKQ